jgi:hypothetical protein
MKSSLSVAVFAVMVFLTAVDVSAQSTPALGGRAGFSSAPDDFYLGLQGEFGRVLGVAYFAPSLDFGLGDTSTLVLNGDLRWYLLPVPETGLIFYAAAGPGLILSPDTGIGLHLTAGLHIPMKGGRRYNVEARFGFGDVPDFKFGASILFGI